MAITFVDADVGVSSTPTINSTGANLVVVTGHQNPAGAFTWATADPSNTLTQLTLHQGPFEYATNRIDYAVSASVGAAQYATTSVAVPVALAAFSGVLASGAFDQQSGAYADFTAVANANAGSVTPTEDGELVLAAWTVEAVGGGYGPFAVDNGFTIIAEIPAVYSTYKGVVLAYKILSGGAGVPVTVNLTSSGGNFVYGASMATFKAAAGGSSPVLSGPTPSGTIGTSTTATIGATTDTASGTLYTVVNTIDLAGSGITGAQIEAGVYPPDGDPVTIGAFNAAVSSTTPTISVASGLSANSTYYYATVQKVGATYSNVVTGSFTTAAAGPAPPSITSVDGDNTVTLSQANVGITGTGFSAATVEIRQGGFTYEPSIDSQSATAIQFDMTVIGSSGSVAAPHAGSATVAVVNGDAQEDTQAITISNDAGTETYVVGTPNADPDLRLTATPDYEAGDYVRISNVVGGSISDVSINSDLTWDADEAVTSFDHQCWDHDDGTWGDKETQSINASELSGEWSVVVMRRRRR